MIELITTPTITIAVDIVGDFGFEKISEQAKSAVEDGSTRSDSKVRKPDMLQIEVKQTEHPIDDPEYSMQDLQFNVEQVRTKIRSPFLLAGAAVRAGVGALVDAVFGADIAPTMQTLQTATPRDRGGELIDQLALLVAPDGELCSVTYRGRQYDSMSLIGLSVTYTVGMGGLTTFRLTFEEVMVAQLQQVALPDPEELAHKSREAEGKKKAKQDAEAKKETPRPQSLLRRFTS